MSTFDTADIPRPTLLDQARELQARVSGRLSMGLHTQVTRYGLGRDLSRPIERPKAKIPISVRPLEVRDFDALFTVPPGANPSELGETAVRRAFANRGAVRGFVAIDERNGTPCYVQWLFASTDNAFVRRMGGFPLLQRDEALVENAYTPAAHRGLGIMSVAMAMIAERAADFGAQHVFTYVGVDNIASLKGCQRAGFNPVLMHHSTRLGFGVVRTDRFEVLAEDDPRRTMKF